MGEAIKRMQKASHAVHTSHSTERGGANAPADVTANLYAGQDIVLARLCAGNDNPSCQEPPRE